MSNRNEFSPDTKNRLAARAGWRCSFTGCGKLTVGPSEESPRSVAMIGKAAHISGAAGGRCSRRYDANLTSEQRSSIKNGIWLCANHADFVDRDEVTFDVAKLQDMKREREAACFRALSLGTDELVNRMIATSAGPLNTQYAWLYSGFLHKVTLPDDSSITYVPDSAQRVEGLQDTLNNKISFSLDAFNNPKEINIYNPSSTLERQHSGTFDALGRMLHDVGGAGQTTIYTYDKNGNALTVTSGRGYKTTNSYDALNRLVSATDPNGGEARFTYDAHDRPLTVIDKAGHTTSFVYNGFGDAIQRTSPDTETDVYHYDSDGNALTKHDASGYTTTWTFDALDRLKTTNYDGDASENESRTYDQKGTGFSFGIGRLTSVTDMAGTLTRAYDERGNQCAVKRGRHCQGAGMARSCECFHYAALRPAQDATRRQPYVSREILRG